MTELEELREKAELIKFIDEHGPSDDYLDDLSKGAADAKTIEKSGN